MPHMDSANNVDEKGHPSVMQMCLEDSFDSPHYGIYDYGFIEIENNKNGKCVELCGDKEKVEISDGYSNSEILDKH